MNIRTSRDNNQWSRDERQSTLTAQMRGKTNSKNQQTINKDINITIILMQVMVVPLILLCFISVRVLCCVQVLCVTLCHRHTRFKLIISLSCYHLHKSSSVYLSVFSSAVSDHTFRHYFNISLVSQFVQAVSPALCVIYQT